MLLRLKLPTRKHKTVKLYDGPISILNKVHHTLCWTINWRLLLVTNNNSRKNPMEFRESFLQIRSEVYYNNNKIFLFFFAYCLLTWNSFFFLFFQTPNVSLAMRECCVASYNKTYRRPSIKIFKANNNKQARNPFGKSESYRAQRNINENVVWMPGIFSRVSVGYLEQRFSGSTLSLRSVKLLETKSNIIINVLCSSQKLLTLFIYLIHK